MQAGRLLLVSGLAMGIGVALYGLLRPEGLLVSEWLGGAWPTTRHVLGLSEPAVVLANVLPGGLWMFSATALQAAIWADRPERAGRVWMLALLALGVGWELAQGIGVLAGTYDPLDLTAYLAGWGLASLLPPRIASIPRERRVPLSEGGPKMRRHLLSALGVLAAVVLGLGTSKSAELDGKWKRTEGAVTVLNANEFEWRGVRVVIWTHHDSWTAQTEILRPGQVLRVAFADLESEAGAFRPEEQPDALVAVLVDEADGFGFSKTLGLAISELPLELTIRE